MLSLFSGGGLLDLGFMKAGFHINDGVEIDENFITAYNGGLTSFVTNLKGAKGEQFSFQKIERSVDASCKVEQRLFGKIYSGINGIIGGPPCQDFSNGGKNRGIKGEKGRLINSYFEFVKIIKPEFIFFENVDALYTTRIHNSAFEGLALRIRNLGYKVYFEVLNSLEYGVPQDRSRLTLVAFRKDVIHSLEKAGYVDSECKEELDHSQRDKAIFNWPKAEIYSPKKRNWPETNTFGSDLDFKLEEDLWPITVEAAWTGISIETKNQSDQFQPYSPKFKTIPEGFVKNKSFKRLHRLRYSPTVAYGNNEVHLHPTEPRRISVREALRLQSVPDEYVLPENLSLTNKFKVIGNGVPVKKSELIAQEVKRTIQNYYRAK